MTIDKVEDELMDVTKKFRFISSAKVILKTMNTIKARLNITENCYIQIYRNVKKGITNYALIVGNQRVFGRNNDGFKWHKHPFETPNTHNFSEDGQRPVTLEEFLEEVTILIPRIKDKFEITLNK